VAGFDPSGESVGARQWHKNSFDEFRTCKQRIVRGKLRAQNLRSSRREIHRQRREEFCRPPLPDGRTNLVLLKDRDIPTTP
jgi:hypothetical protein